MPLTNSYNATAANNEQPEYQMLWEPLGINPASVNTNITIPASAGAGAWVAGALLGYGLTGTPAGVGTNPGPGGDASNGSPYTIQYVDLAAVSETTYLAGVLLGVGALGANAPVAPNAATQNGAVQYAMVGKRGICQVLVDNTTTVGNTLVASATSTHTGQASDSGGTTRTFGACIGVALQAVTVSSGPKLVWAHINMP